MAKMVTGSVVKVSKALVSGAVATVTIVGSQLAETLSETEFGKKISEKGTEKTEAAKHVARSSLSAIVTVYDALEDAGLTLLSDMTDSTVNVLTYKYGADVGQTAADSLGIVKDLATCAVVSKRVGFKPLVQRTAAQTTISMLNDQKLEGNTQQIDPATGIQTLMLINQIANINNPNIQNNHPSNNINNNNNNSVINPLQCD